MTDNTPVIHVDALRAEAEQRSDLLERQADHVMDKGASSPLAMFMSPAQRELAREAATKELEKGFEYRHESMAMALELRLQSFREACNQVLVNGKASLRQQRLQYFTETYAQVERHLNRLTEEFLEELDGRFDRIARFRNELLRQRETRRLEKRLDDFLNTFDELMSHFASILNEEIGHPAEKAAIPQTAPQLATTAPTPNFDINQYEEEHDAPKTSDYRL